jgi:hypothetical protein
MAGKGTVGQLLVEMRADLGKLRLDVKEMEGVFKTSFTNLESMAKGFTNILGASLGVGALIAYGKQLVALGGQLKDLSQQTGISGQTLSGIKSTLEENGTSLDAFAKGIFTLQKNLGGIKNESDPAAQAVKALGLNLDQIRQADTETFLQLITDALGKVENPINRAALGAQLLGKNFRELGPAIEEISGHLAQLRKSGLSDADINTLDEFGDAWTRLNNRLKVVAAEGLAEIIRDLSNINFLFSQMFNKSAAVGALLGAGGGALAERAKVSAPFKPPVDEAAAKKLADELQRQIESIQKSNAALQAQIIEMESGKEAAQNYILAQQEMEENSKGISAALKTEQDRRRDLTDQLRLEKQALEDLQTISKAWIKDIDALTDAEEKWAAIKMDAESLGLDDLSKTLDQISKKYIKLVVDAQAAAAAAGALPDEIEAVTRRLLIDKALEQVRARVGFAGEGVDAEAEAKARADKLGEDLANSLTSGMKNTLLGIETGQQSLGEGMKNLVRNMLLELEGAIFDKTILDPLKAIAAGFISGLVGALDDAANTQLKDWAKDLGKQVSSWLGSGLSSILGSFGGGGAGAGTTFTMGGAFPTGGATFGSGGMIPSFASGGLFIGHGGEFVMQKKAVDNIGADTLGQMNKTGKVPGGGTAVNVEINGDITPRQPNMTPDQIIRVTAGNITNDGMVMSAIEQRLRLRGK